MIRIALAGASGKMGLEVVRALHGVDDIRLAAAVSRTGAGEDVGALAGIGPIGVPLGRDLAAALDDAQPDVLVDFTVPDRVRAHIDTALEAGVHVVVGTTGLSARDVPSIDRAAREAGVGVIIAPNFALGAILMMRFAREAARHLPDVEIIELHHDQKKDAPSGTAVLTAEMVETVLAEAAASGTRRSGGGDGLDDPAWPRSRGGNAPARGEAIGSVRVHSVRLPGLIAHQEILFGGPGQLLTLRHDSYNRTSFMPGVLLAIRRVMDIRGCVYGLESIMFPEDR